MIRRTFALALAFLALGAFASAARASDLHHVGERDATSNLTVMAAVRFASGWLAQHGKIECATKPGGTVRMAPDLGTTHTDDGEVEVGGAALGCDVWLKTEIVAEANRRNAYGLLYICTISAHELAHTAGMTHDDMAASGLEAAWTRACGYWTDAMTRMIAADRHDRHSRVARVVLPTLPSGVVIVIGQCPGLEGEAAGCAFRAGESDVYGHAYGQDTIYTTGDRFTTRHELGHIYANRYLDHPERNRFASLTLRVDIYWTGTYVDEQGRTIQDPASLDEVFADAFANCSLGHVVASGQPWEAGYDYYPTPKEHREVCRFIAKAGRTPGAPVDTDGWR